MSDTSTTTADRLRNARGKSNWVSKTMRTSNGGIISNLGNALLALREDAAFCDAFAYDEMLCTPTLLRPLFKAEPDFKPRPVSDTDVAAVQEYLQLNGLRKLGKDTVHQAVDLRAHECGFHPVRDYLDALQWDGKQRLDNWLMRLSRRRGHRLLTGHRPDVPDRMVARIFEPGCKADYMLVLEGAAGHDEIDRLRGAGRRLVLRQSCPTSTAGKDVSAASARQVADRGRRDARHDKAEASLLKSFITRTDRALSGRAMAARK